MLILKPNIAVIEALATAQIQLADEREAFALCSAKGYESDAAFAERQIRHYTALIERLKRRLIES
jgi:hypothetical protein